MRQILVDCCGQSEAALSYPTSGIKTKTFLQHFIVFKETKILVTVKPVILHHVLPSPRVDYRIIGITPATIVPLV